MKYPIDPLTTETLFGHLIQNDRTQKQLIIALSALLREAMDEMGADDTPWYDEGKKLFKLQQQIKMEHENRLFNAKNGHPENHTVTIEGPIETGKMDSMNEKVYVPGVKIDPEMNVKLNEAEKAFGEEMSEEELARHFGQRAAKKMTGGVDMSKKEPFKGMTLEEIEEWEASQNNANDIYKIKARVQNLAVGISGGNLTPVGEMMVNSFVHVVKDLYEFAETIPDKSLKIALSERIRKHESMPGTLISAAASGVKASKK